MIAVKRAVTHPAHLQIARHLAEHGPTAGADLADALSLKDERFWQLIHHPWFRLTGKGWALSERGRAEGRADPLKGGHAGADTLGANFQPSETPACW